MIEVKHVLKRKYDGKGILQKVTPTCSCGWIGVGYEAHNDWHMTLVMEQEKDHMRSVFRNHEWNDGHGTDL